MRTLLVLLSVLVATSLALADSPASATQPAPAPTSQPRVFRCVLDGNPRMLVIDFRNGVMAAFDTQKCELVKVWRGDVEFTGTVYDTKHGPQPKSRGETIDFGGSVGRLSGKWSGYRLELNGVVLNVLCPDGIIRGIGLKSSGERTDRLPVSFSLVVPITPETVDGDVILLPPATQPDGR